MNNLQKKNTIKSGLYTGFISHKRFSPKSHAFSYKISMLGIFIDELEHITRQHRLFGTQWFNPVQFNEKDYLKSEPGTLKQRIVNKVNKLGGNWDGYNVLMITQCRCLGLYFSPINFYYCFDKDDECNLMLAEVSNTPWNERHYYLVNLTNKTEANNVTKKAFHVSPFMPLNMNYHWNVSAPSSKAFINIQNFNHSNTEKVFEANMVLTKQSLSVLSLLKSWLSLPFTAVKIVSLIYWQATKLLLKRVPIVDKS